MSILNQLKEMTIVVADTGEISSIKKYRPRDATTNPSLLLSAASIPEYRYLIEEAVYGNEAISRGNPDFILENLTIKFANEILKVIPGRVSIEVDPKLSFDVKATVEACERLIQLLEKSGNDRSRVLIKIAATWEGILAAKILEQKSIKCNLTLIFSFIQACACAEAEVALISPFVGRILDWHLKEKGLREISPEADPGVLSLKRIYEYFKKFDYKTEIMGASFRNVGEILELAGCDLLTISPELLRKLDNMDWILERKLSPLLAKSADVEKIEIDEKYFRWILNQDAMATEKLAQGIRKFTMDHEKLLVNIHENFLKN